MPAQETALLTLKCPECGTGVQGEAGQDVVCPQCGFKATVPAATAQPASEEAPEPKPVAEETPKKHSRLGAASHWAYLFGVTSIATFFLANYGVPFVLGAAGIGLGLRAVFPEKKDRLALIASILGGVGIVLALVRLLLS